MPTPEITQPNLTREWRVPLAATFGSSVRSRGILLELLSRLPVAMKKSLGIKSGVLTLTIGPEAERDFQTASAIISKALAGIKNLPIIPREIEDILGITSTERHRWLKNGRLRSAGTRTVNLRGRASKVTFHVFDPSEVEDVLDKDLVGTWREEDAITKAENRRWALEKRALSRKSENADGMSSRPDDGDDSEQVPLEGWAEFERTGLLR